MDRAKKPRAKRWFPQCHVSLSGNAIFCSTMLHLPLSLCAITCLAEEKGYEKKLVSQQEIIPSENGRSSRKRRIP